MVRRSHIETLKASHQGAAPDSAHHRRERKPIRPAFFCYKINNIGLSDRGEPAWMRIDSRLHGRIVNQDRRLRGRFRTLFEQNPGRRADDVHALRAWHPAARVAVVVMLGILAGINIWMDAVLKINSLPKLHVTVSPARLGDIGPHEEGARRFYVSLLYKNIN